MPGLPLDVNDALRAMALDSIDEKILKTWAALRRVSYKNALTPWVKENYWPLQSLGLRLAAQAALNEAHAQGPTARAQMDTVALLAQDLAAILGDRLLQKHAHRLQSLPVKNKAALAEMLLALVQGHALMAREKYAAALDTFLQAQPRALQLGDSLAAVEIGIGRLNAHAGREDYARLAAESEECIALAQAYGYHWAQAQALNLRAEAERILGRDAHALACAQQALQIAGRLRDRRTQRDSHFYRARIFYEQENFLAAEAALQEAAARDEEQLYSGEVLLLQGQMHFDRGEYGLAQEDLERAAANFQDRRDTVAVAVAFSTLSLLYVEQGDYQNACEAEQQALAIHRRGNQARRLGWCYMNLAFIHAKFDSLARAEDALAQALTHLRPGAEPRVLVEALTLQGALNLNRKAEPAAARAFAEAETLAQKVGYQYGAAKIFIGQARLALAKNRMAAADSLWAAAENLGRHLREPHLLTEIFFQRALSARRQREAAKSLRWLEEAMSVLEQRFASIGRDSLRMQFFATTQELFDAAILQSLALQQNERALQFAERGRARALLESMGAGAPERSLDPLPEIPSVSEMQRLLPANSQAIAYRVTADSMIAWVVGKNKFVCRTLPLAQAALSDSVGKFRESLGAEEGPAFRRRVSQNASAVYLENRRRGRALFKILLEPLQDSWHPNDQTYLIPDDVLHLVPFGALVTPRARFLEEENVLIKVPSLAILAQGLRSPRVLAGMATNRLLLVSNPAGDFPAAEAESAALCAIFPRHKLLQREQASFANLDEQLRRGAEILHLSLHAQADPQRPLNSYIAMSAPQASAASLQTEKIFARRMQQADLSGVWLALLNGCETATGRIVHGEGALNFSRMFALQRVPVVVATLWKNDDWQSVPLVAGFYRALAAGVDPAVALQRAKIETITELLRSREKVALPYFWAVFEIYLNQSLELSSL